MLTEADAEPFWRVRLRALRDHPDLFGMSYEEVRDRPLAEVAADLRTRYTGRDSVILGAFLGSQLVGVAGWYIVVFRGAAPPTVLAWSALPYALLLASTTGVATGLAVQESRFTPLVIGAALFLLSDLILAGQLFRRAHFALIGDVVWLTYGTGQMLIVYACGAAIQVAGDRIALHRPTANSKGTL